MCQYKPGSLSILRSLDAIAKYDLNPQTESFSQSIFSSSDKQISHFVESICHALESLCLGNSLSIEMGRDLALTYYQTVSKQTTFRCLHILFYRSSCSILMK